MAKTYAEYVSPQGSDIIDWRSLAGELSESITGAIGTRSREREAFEAQRLSNEEKIRSYELGQNQTMNDLVLDGADEVKSLLWETNNAANEGLMTRADYNKIQSTVMSYWDNFANSAKSFDERMMNSMTRQNNGEASTFEGYLNEMHADLADLKNKKIYVSESGAIYLAKYDEDGNIIDQVDVRQINNPGNAMDNRLDLDKTINKTVETWGDWTIFEEGARGSSTTVTDLRANKEVYDRAKLSLIDSILTNSRSIAGVLVDNSPEYYDYYSSDSEKDRIIKDRVAFERRVSEAAGVDFSEEEFIKELEGRLILVERDETGVFQPVITDEQREAAEQIISDKIEIQVGRTEKGTTQRAPTYRVSGDDRDTDDSEGPYSVYPVIRTAWKEGDADLMNTVALDGYKFVFSNVENGKPAAHGFKVQRYRGMEDGKA